MLHRAARRAAPTYKALVDGIRASPVVAPDETGWRVAGRRAWLWAFAGKGVVVYRIAPGRGFDDAAVVLGSGYAGVLERDGWAPYRQFTAADHQSCLAHLLRRCAELLADAERGQAKTPHAVRRILQAGLAARDGRVAGELDTAQVAAEAERLGVAVDRLIAGQTVYAPNRRLLDHLARERGALFTFLLHDDVQATNWRAEHAIRPAVVCRKAWGGNRTWTGARPGRCCPACWPLLRCSSATRSRCWCRCCVRPARSWPSLPSPAPSPAWRAIGERGPACPTTGALPRDRHRTGRKQYTAIRLTQRLADAGIQPSMGSVGDCLLTG